MIILSPNANETVLDQDLYEKKSKEKKRLIEPSFAPRCSPPYSKLPSYAHVHPWLLHLAGSATAGDVRAGGGLLTTSDGVTTPSPVGASTLSTEDVDIGGRAGNSSSVLGHGQTSNGDASGGCASWGTVLVVLLDDNAVFLDAGKGVAAVCDTRNGTGGARDSLDTDTVVAVDDLVVGEVDVADSVVIAAANGTDRKTVTTSTRAAGEGDVS